MSAVSANGITIEYESIGDGDPLLLVMGLGGQLTDWPEGFPELFADAGYRVITFDNRDIGLSTEFDWEPPKQTTAIARGLARRPVHSEYHLADMADDAIGLMDALEIDAAHVVGISMGGMIAQSMAIAQPSRVKSLTSVMSNTGDRKNGRVAAKIMPKLARLPTPTRDTAGEVSAQSFALFTGPHFDAEEHKRRTKISVARSFRPVGVARQTAAIMASPDRTPALRELNVPSLVIHGLVDKLVKPNGGVATARAIPGSRLLMFPDMGHDLPAPRHQEIVEAIDRNAGRAR